MEFKRLGSPHLVLPAKGFGVWRYKSEAEVLPEDIEQAVKDTRDYPCCGQRNVSSAPDFSGGSHRRCVGGAPQTTWPDCLSLASYLSASVLLSLIWSS